MLEYHFFPGLCTVLLKIIWSVEGLIFRSTERSELLLQSMGAASAQHLEVYLNIRNLDFTLNDVNS